MPRGFGRGRSWWFGFPGWGGFGFRGWSPPWPFIGWGRGGLPRCWWPFAAGFVPPFPYYGVPYGLGYLP